MIRIKSPGRICLFGEHQDYLDYPIISMAISKYIYLEAERISEPKFLINMPNLNSFVEISLNNKELHYESNRDYLISGYNQFLRKRSRFGKGYRIKITGDIPINAGVASSSALVIAWLYFLNIISDTKLNLFQLAVEGYNTEVKEFKEGGGMMDHFSSVFGNLIFLKPVLPKPDLIAYDLNLKGFVLGNSMEKKETVDDLVRTKNLTLDAFEKISDIMPGFNQFYTKLEDLQPFLLSLKKEHQKKIVGNIINRDITYKAKELIDKQLSLLKQGENSKNMVKFYRKLGHLLNLHQEQLRDNIQISTNKINKIIAKCLSSGALGGKINGSGFGGTMFALMPNNVELLKNVIEDAGGEAFIIETSKGVEMY